MGSEEDSRCIRDHFPENAVLIIGGGHFGKRAARILSREKSDPLYIVDKDENSLMEVEGKTIEKILCDAVDFLVRNFPSLAPSNILIPAVPLHLAFEWLKNFVNDDLRISQLEVPEEIKPFLPHTWPGSEGSLLISYSDFPCPDDCPEPGSHCTVTGEKRSKPLYELLSELKFSNYRVHVLRSHQLAPGLGGYRAEDLMGLVDRVKGEGKRRLLLATACKCHGMLTALDVSKA